MYKSFIGSKPGLSAGVGFLPIIKPGLFILVPTGTDTIPAKYKVNSKFFTGDESKLILKTDLGQIEPNVTIAEDKTPEEYAIKVAEVINASSPNYLASAIGDIVEVLANGTALTVELVSVVITRA